MDMGKIAVLKFGGTSMGSASSMQECMKLAKERISQGKRPFFVVSAISKMTDSLLRMLEFAKHKKKKDISLLLASLKKRHFDILNELTSNQELLKKYTQVLNKKFSLLMGILNGVSLLGDYSDKTHALIASFGEDLSSELMECCLIENGIKAKKISSKNFVKTKGDYLAAEVDFAKTKIKFKKILKQINDVTFVMTGFFGSDGKNIQLLGRGGSDFSGSIAGVSLGANIVEIWTDANGIMSADPRIIKNAKSWTELNRDIAAEMARAGAKVLHPKTIVATFYGVDVLVKNTFDKDGPGTLINSLINENGVRGIITDDNFSIIHLENQDMFGNSGFVSKIGKILERNNVSIDIITTSETSVSITIKTKDLSKNLVENLEKISRVRVINDTTKVSVIGSNINNSDIYKKIFEALDSDKITPLLVNSNNSNCNVGIIVATKDKEKCLLGLHNKIF
ncbi:MAG: aspartate kinase [Rickettsiales bacterium]|jgi:aspartate kinase|nr:aspartate kinase [Rickettsiales bacterium]